MENNYIIIEQDHVHCGKCYIPVNQGEPLYRGLCVNCWIRMVNGEE